MISNSVMLYVDSFKGISDPQNMASKVISLLFCLFVCVLDLVFFETGFLCVALAVLELTL